MVKSSRKIRSFMHSGVAKGEVCGVGVDRLELEVGVRTIGCEIVPGAVGGM